MTAAWARGQNEARRQERIDAAVEKLRAMPSADFADCPKCGEAAIYDLRDFVGPLDFRCGFCGWTR